jgi:hypothetical protein
MESTQNKIYEIEESALIDQNLKNNIDEDVIGEENKNGIPNTIFSNFYFQIMISMQINLKIQ